MLRLTESRRYLIECALVGGVVTVWIALLAGGPLNPLHVSNVGLAAISLAAAGAAFVAGRREGGREGRVWTLLAAAFLSWALGQLIWTWHESVLGNEPFPSLADVGYLGAVPLVIAALLTMPTAAQSTAGRMRTVLDGLIIACSLFLTSWVLVLGAVVRQPDGGLLADAIVIAYPAGDVILVTIIAYVLLRERRTKRIRRRLPLGMVGLGLFAIAVSDSGFAYLQVTEDYSSGGLIDTGWFVGFAILLLAARRPVPELPADESPDDRRPLGLLLPYAAVGVALVVSVVHHLTAGVIDPVVSWSRTVLIALLVVRQVLTLLENVSLTRHLEARVAARTAELEASKARFEALVQHSSEVVTVVGLDSTVMYQSESVQRVFGRDPRELLGAPLTAVCDHFSAEDLRRGLLEAAREPYSMRELELTILHPDGHARQVETTITNLLENPNVQGLVLNTHDVTERRQLEDQLVHEAFHDSLTGLANRTLFTNRVDHALRRRSAEEGGVAVLFLDLDGFKEINDSLGHSTGDVLLTLVAERLRECVRPSDTVARFGGDEFAVLVEDDSRVLDPTKVADRITAALKEPFQLLGQEIHVRASIGIATADDPDGADQLMRNADLAMYRAKSSGHGGYTHYDPRMHADLVARLELEYDLRRALEGDEFVLHYQPTMSLATGQITGVEALLRWRHPVRGLVPPGEFIPAAENVGLIRPMGRWVLREACRQAAAWRDEHGTAGTFLMSANISASQLQHGDLAQEVAEALQMSGLEPGQLVLEMTESVLMEHTEQTQALLTRLREMGVRLAIDDFGTGYSSLSYLQRFHFDIIKIDRSFVERLVEAPGDADLVRTIVQLGQSLHMTTVAEGIEDQQQVRALQRIGCDIGQGYYFSRPAPVEDIEVLLRADADATVDAGLGRFERVSASEI